MAVQTAYHPLPIPALYYPYADFQSKTWVKLALINWDRIERIKPAGYPHEDRVATQRLLDSGWLEDVTPNDGQLEKLAYQFRQLLEVSGLRLRNKYAVDQRDAWSRARFGTPPHGADERLAYVYAGDKFTPELADDLARRGLALKHYVGDETWVGLHPRLASVYMCALTEVIADDRKLVPVTDDEAVYHAAGRSTLDRLEEALAGDPQTRPKPSLEEVESQYVEIALRSVLNPVNLDELSIERVLDCRAKYSKELQAFQSHVFNLRTDVLELCQISDGRELQHRLRDLYKTRTEPELKDLQAKLHNFGIRSVPGFLELRIDREHIGQTIGGAVAIAGAHALLGPAAPVVAPLAISVVAIPYIRRRWQEKELLEQGSPASLLLAIQREEEKDRRTSQPRRWLRRRRS